MTIDTSEKIQSQIPALQLLVQLGFVPLPPLEVEKKRKSLRHVLLEDILVKQLLEINGFSHKGRAYPFDLSDAHEALRRLKPGPDRLKGLQATNMELYDLLVLGTTITKTIAGDSKSYSLRYIDWEKPDRNVYHVTPELVVERSGGAKTRRCDLVCYVNGIPFVIIENKRPGESLKKAESQLIKYQGPDNIPQLFHYAQLLLTMNRVEAKFATVGTPAKFWVPWGGKEGTDEEDLDESIDELINSPVRDDLHDLIFTGGFKEAAPYFSDLERQGLRAITAQDRLIYALCRRERLLDIVRRFTVFDGGIRKVARHQQFFAISKAMDRVKQLDADGKRRGGVVWHTQGSGKSLTMVMLGRALALDSDIKNPRMIIVTDRVDLDRQIKGTFKSCDLEPVQARTGTHLLSLIQNKKPLVTTLVNKFETAAARGDFTDDDPNIFVLVDESHRGHTGRHGGFATLAIHMRRMLPQACYLGFTGTPLLKKEKNTLGTFGGLIHKYTIDQAVDDGAVVPLLYEGRLVGQQITGEIIDSWFEKISRGLTVEQKADLKRKFSRADALSRTEQAISAKAFDISEHYRQHWQGTGFKAQLVAPSKAAAVRFKEILDDIGHVSSEIIISPPDDKEGNEQVGIDPNDKVRRFWDQMMKKYRTQEEYNRRIIDAFQNGEKPEILIVVSKLLTGFDAPRNTVLYVCRSLREHNLLQAIARVNRLYDADGQEKEFGFIIDYEGLLGELDAALSTYSSFEGYDEEDLAHTVHDVRDEIQRLSPLHNQLWDVFKTVANKKDMEAFEQLLGDEAVREEFYDKLKLFNRCLHISLSSQKAYDVYPEKELQTFQQDWKLFSGLKHSVQLRYQETVNLKDYEPKIRKLLDDHVVAMPAQTIINLVNINDPDALNKVIEEQDITAASKADRIASATKKTISEHMEKDPALYRRFSEMLKRAIEDYREKRISEQEYLKRIIEVAQGVANKETNHDVPPPIRGNEDAEAFYRILEPSFKDFSDDAGGQEQVAKIALDIVGIIEKPKHRVVNRWSNSEVQNNIKNAIDDYFFEVVRDEKGIYLPVGTIDDLQSHIIRLARARFPG